MLTNPQPTTTNTPRTGFETRQRLSVALTFDDGYLDHYRIAQLLYRRRISATFFLITGLSSWKNKRLLTMRPNLIRRMKRMNHEVASHTQTHPNLLHMTNEQVHWELQSSKEYLASLLDEQVEGFAYPYGKCDERIVRITSNYYSYARTASELKKRSRYQLPILHPGLSLRVSTPLMTKRLIRGNDFAIILLHSINQLSLRVWIEYLSLFHVRFAKLSEIVASQYGLPVNA